MQVSVETTSSLERRLTITIPAEKIEAEFNKRVQQAAPNVQLNGFRKGKVPVKVVRQRYGSGIRQEVLGDMMSSSFQDAVIQEKLKPAGQPKVETKDSKDKVGDDFSFVATFEIFPEITLKDIEGVDVHIPSTLIEDADVNEMIDNVRKQQATYEEVDREAALEDQVNIDYEGKKDGELFDGGAAEGTDLVLGSKSMIPGFEDGLVGLKAGEETTLHLTFPEDYHAEELKGAAVEFAVKVNTVSSQKLPEIDDAFIEKMGVSEGGLDALKAKVRENMEKELGNAQKARVKNQVMEALLEKNPLEVPKALIDQEIDQLKRQMVQQFSQGQPMPDFDLSMLPSEMFQERASRRVTLGLLLSRALDQYAVKASEEEVRAAVEAIAADYEAKDEVIDWYYNNEQQLSQVEAMVLEENVVNLLLEKANQVDEKLTYQELMAKLNQQD